MRTRKDIFTCNEHNNSRTGREYGHASNEYNSSSSWGGKLGIQ
jgi:hypothetical protein